MKNLINVFNLGGEGLCKLFFTNYTRTFMHTKYKLLYM